MLGATWKAVKQGFGCTGLASKHLAARMV
jgi:hypothetical protein